MARVPFTSILEKDAFLQSLAMDDQIYQNNKSNQKDIDELFMINLLKGDLPNSSLSSSTSSSTLIAPIYNQPTQFRKEEIPYLDYTMPNYQDNNINNINNTNIRNNARSNSSTILLEHGRKQSTAKSVSFQDKDSNNEIEMIKEHCKRLEEANKKLKERVATQDLWASGQRKYVKELVQQLKSKDGIVEELQNELKKKQKAIESLKVTKANTSETLHEPIHSEGRIDKKKDDQQIQILNEQLKESRKREQRNKDITNTYKEQMTKRDTSIAELETKNAELIKSNGHLSKQLKKIEGENEILANNLNKITQQYGEIKSFCEQLCTQTTKVLQTQRDINGKIVSLSL